MNRKIIYLVNPISGTKKKAPLLHLINETSTQHKIPFEIIETNSAGDYQFLKDKIAQEQVTDVVICGGDGTINQVAAHLVFSKVNMGIIPMGSGNGLAFAAGISRKTSKALKIIFKGESKSIDAFTVNGRFGCMLSGVGFDAQVAHEFAHKTYRGLFTYLKLCFKNYHSSAGHHFVIDINGKSISTNAFFISVANSNQFGNFVTIAPRARLNDGLLDIVIVNKKNKIATAMLLVKHILTGKLTPAKEVEKNKKSILYLQSAKLTISNPSLAPLHIDGEPVASAPKLEFSIIHNALNLLQP